MLYVFVFFFFKQKTAYEMRISDWSSDVCSSDLFGSDRTDSLQLLGGDLARQQGHDMACLALAAHPVLVIGFGHRGETHLLVELVGGEQDVLEHRLDRKSVV